MNISDQIKGTFTDPLQSFRSLQRIIALVCITIPLWLWIFDKDEYYPQRVTLMSSVELKDYLLQEEVDSIDRLFRSMLNSQIKLKYFDSTIEINGLAKIPKDNLDFRLSISDYAYSSNGYLFGLLYMMAAMLYIYNGVVHMKRKETLDVQQTGQWWNLLIGVFLIGVVINPQSSNPFLHNLFSILFFLGNICVMLFIPKQHESKRFKKTRIIMGSVCVLVLLGLLAGWNWYTVLRAEWIALFIIALYLFRMSGSVHEKSMWTMESPEARRNTDTG
jgi:hypothetical membrane protein